MSLLNEQKRSAVRKAVKKSIPTPQSAPVPVQESQPEKFGRPFLKGSFLNPTQYVDPFARGRRPFDQNVFNQSPSGPEKYPTTKKMLAKKKSSVV